MRKHRSLARKRAQPLRPQLGYSPGKAIDSAAQPIAKKPKSKSRLPRAAKHGGTAGGKRARMRADKPRRADGGDIQAEPLPPPSRNIPGTDIPDQSQSEEASIGTTHVDTDLKMPNAYDTSPNKNMDLAGAPRVDPDNYPGIVNPPIRGSHKPRATAPYRR